MQHLNFPNTDIRAEDPSAVRTALSHWVTAGMVTLLYYNRSIEEESTISINKYFCRIIIYITIEFCYIYLCTQGYNDVKFSENSIWKFNVYIFINCIYSKA